MQLAKDGQSVPPGFDVGCDAWNGSNFLPVAVLLLAEGGAAVTPVSSSASREQDTQKSMRSMTRGMRTSHCNDFSASADLLRARAKANGCPLFPGDEDRETRMAQATQRETGRRGGAPQNRLGPSYASARRAQEAIEAGQSALYVPHPLLYTCGQLFWHSPLHSPFTADSPPPPRPAGSH